MKLYHYAAQHFDALRTLEKQRPITAKEIQAGAEAMQSGIYPGPYYTHISFFVEPVPLDILSKIFPKEHASWFSGSRLYQYTIDAGHIGAFKYLVTETPEKSVLYYDDSLDTKAYYRRYLKQLHDLHHVGEGAAQLEKAVKPYLGKTRGFFEQIPQRPNYAELKLKYAATVPHVMLYPESGVIEYESVKKVVVK